jgi:hypothetical protein
VLTGTPVSRARRALRRRRHARRGGRAARALNRAGLTVSLDYLGESVKSREEAEAGAEMAIRTLEQIAENG